MIATNGNGHPRLIDTQGRPLLTSPTKGYKSVAAGIVFGGIGWTGIGLDFIGGGPLADLPHFTRTMIEAMKRESLCKFATGMVKSPYSSAGTLEDPQDRESGFKGFFVDCPNPAVKRTVEDALSKIWLTGSTRILEAMDYGQVGIEIELQCKRRQIGVECVKGFDPADVQALRNQRTGRIEGVRVRRVPNKAKVDLVDGRGVWIVHEPIFDSHIGFPIHLGAYPPWWEKWHHRGAIFSRRLWMLNCAFRGRVVRYPMMIFGAEHGFAVAKSGRDIAIEIVDNCTNGGALAIPNLFDDKGNPLWATEDPKAMEGGQQIVEYPKDLDTEQLRGYGIPDNIITATLQDSTGTYGGRAISFEAFLAMRQIFWVYLLSEIDRQSIRHIVRWNHGPRADYELRATELMPREKPNKSSEQPDGMPGLPMMGDQPDRMSYSTFLDRHLDEYIERAVGRGTLKASAVVEGQKMSQLFGPWVEAGIETARLSFDESEHPRDEDGKFEAVLNKARTEKLNSGQVKSELHKAGIPHLWPKMREARASEGGTAVVTGGSPRNRKISKRPDDSPLSDDEVSKNVQHAHEFLTARGATLDNESESGSRYYTMPNGTKIRVADHEPNEATSQWMEREGVEHIRTDKRILDLNKSHLAEDHPSRLSFDESKHPRGQPENAGEFSATEHARGTVAAHSLGGPVSAKNLKAAMNHLHRAGLIPRNNMSSTEAAVHLSRERVTKEVSEAGLSPSEQGFKSERQLRIEAAKHQPQEIDREAVHRSSVAAAESWKKSLSPREVKAIIDYAGTDKVFEINRSLRKQTGSVHSATVEWLDKAIAKGQATNDMMVYRGLSKDFDLKEGDTFSDRSFVSTSFDASEAKGFVEEGGAIMRIKVPQGTKGAYIGAVSKFSELEFLLPRNQKFRVAKKSQNAEGFTEYDLELDTGSAPSRMAILPAGDVEPDEPIGTENRFVWQPDDVEVANQDSAGGTEIRRDPDGTVTVMIPSPASAV